MPPIPSSANCTLLCRLGDDGKLPPRRGALLLSATEGAGDAGNGNGAADAGAATSNSPNAADAANDADDGCTLLERGCGDMFDS